MLKISIQEKTGRVGPNVRLILQGRLAGAWVQELENTWKRANAEGAESISLDLHGVEFISDGGEALLRRMYQQGTNLIAGQAVDPSCVDSR